MGKKSNYSEVQQMDRNKVLKKIAIIGALLIVLFVALFIAKILMSDGEKNTVQKEQESAQLTMVPTTTYYYDPQEESSYDVGVNYVVLASGEGFLKVDSSGNVTRVSSDGTYLKDATDEETKSALTIAQNIIKNDNLASIALSGLEKNIPVEEEPEPQPEVTTLDRLYAAAAEMGYDKNTLNKQLYAAGSTPDAAVSLIDAGMDTATLIKSVMSSAAKAETETSSKALTANIEQIGLVETTTAVAAVEEEETDYPDWLDEPDFDADMSAIMSTLSSAVSSGSSTTATTQWESTNKQSEKNSWQTEQQSTEVTASRLTRYDLVAGTIVPITIVTGVNSDLPGQIVGIVRQDVYDSLTGTNVLVPKGSRLLASYNSSVSFGQKSLQIAWSQLITTDGYQFSLPGFNGVTPEGYSGVSGDTNNHFWSMLGGAVLGSMIDWGATTAKSAAGSLVSGEALSSLVSALFDTTIDTTSTVGQQYATMWASLQPTITIKTGTQTQMLVNQTISLRRPSTSYTSITNSF